MSVRCEVYDDIHCSKRSADGTGRSHLSYLDRLILHVIRIQPYAHYDTIKRIHHLYGVQSPGGFGNFDIWMVELNDKYQGKPVNLVLITTKDEGTPL